MKSNKEHWNETLRRYRISKSLRYYRQKHNLTYSEMAKIMGVARQYIYSIEELILKPSSEFIKVLRGLENEKTNKQNIGSTKRAKRDEEVGS